MIHPSRLSLINSRKDVEIVVSDITDFLREQSLYDFLIDALWCCFSAQKHTLEQFNWQDSTFYENSKDWLDWTTATHLILPLEASYSEEILTTIRLWLSRGEDTKNRLKLLATRGSVAAGVMQDSRFAVFDTLRLNDCNDIVEPQRQGCFIDTLQHERVHVFCRYWRVLQYDIPFATALGLLAGQMALSRFDVTYHGWDLACNHFSWSHSIDGAESRRRNVFLRSVEDLLRRYAYQVEDHQSYGDGADLAVASTHYFRDVAKARIFVELLAYGLCPDEAHDLAADGRGKSNIFWNDNSAHGLVRGPFRVFDTITHKLKMSGWWSPDSAVEDNVGLFCARQAAMLHTGVFQRLSDRSLDGSVALRQIGHLMGLRGADQFEAKHFAVHGDTYVFHSIPSAAYTSTPLLSNLACELLRKLHSTTQLYVLQLTLHDILRDIGLGDFALDATFYEAMGHSEHATSIWNEYLRLLPRITGILSDLNILTKRWTEHPATAPLL